MGENIKKDTWLWVVVQDPDGKAEIIGQQDKEADVAFIPTFKSKEEAYQCFNLLARPAGKKTEVQAIIYEDLKQYAAEGGFMIFILNGQGEVQEKIAHEGL